MKIVKISNNWEQKFKEEYEILFYSLGFERLKKEVRINKYNFDWRYYLENLYSLQTRAKRKFFKKYFFLLDNGTSPTLDLSYNTIDFKGIAFLNVYYIIEHFYKEKHSELYDLYRQTNS